MNRTYKDRAEYIKKYVSDRRRKIKLILIEYLGGKCVLCGYNKCVWALDFHHIDPNTKSFSISSTVKSIDTLKKEADKCVLLCANCHREVEAGFSKLIIHK